MLVHIRMLTGFCCYKSLSRSLTAYLNRGDTVQLYFTREKTEVLETPCYLALYTTSHYIIIMKVFELSVKAQGEGEFSRLGTFSIMNARGLSCSEVKDYASTFSYFIYYDLYIAYAQNIFAYTS